MLETADVSVAPPLCSRQAILRSLEHELWAMYMSVLSSNKAEEHVMYVADPAQAGVKDKLVMCKAPDGMVLPFMGPLTLARTEKSLAVANIFGLDVYLNPMPAPPSGDIVVPAWLARHAGKGETSTVEFKSDVWSAVIDLQGRVEIQPKGRFDNLFKFKACEADAKSEIGNIGDENGNGPNGDDNNDDDEPEVTVTKILRNAVTQTSHEGLSEGGNENAGGSAGASKTVTKVADVVELSDDDAASAPTVPEPDTQASASAPAKVVVKQEPREEPDDPEFRSFELTVKLRGSNESKAKDSKDENPKPEPGDAADHKSKCASVAITCYWQLARNFGPCLNASVHHCCEKLAG